MVVYNVSQRISARALKCSKQIHSRELSRSFCVFNFGFLSRMKTISRIRQSSFHWTLHFECLALKPSIKLKLFQFDGRLYEEVDGVAMGSPLGPLVANAFLCSIEEQLGRENKLPSFYRRYVICQYRTFKVNEFHPSIHFTMEIADINKLPLLGMMTEKKGCKLVTSVYPKTNEQWFPFTFSEPRGYALQEIID